MEDLKGLKIRTPSAAVTPALQILGATPVGMPVPEVPQALSTEVISGALIPWEVAKSLRLQEMTRFHTQPATERGFYTSVFLLAMNRAKYNSLPADLKKVIDNNSGMNIAREIGQAFDLADLEGQELAKERGNVFYTLPAEEAKRWEQATLPVIDEWVKNMDKRGNNGKEMLAAARNLIDKYSNQAK
jgi:TRAP-type transport system periplasmic protein